MTVTDEKVKTIKNWFIHEMEISVSLVASTSLRSSTRDKRCSSYTMKTTRESSPYNYNRSKIHTSFSQVSVEAFDYFGQ